MHAVTRPGIATASNGKVGQTDDCQDKINSASLGGGFKENDNIEYVRRDSDDEMYDEFGRLKKKYRKRKAQDSATRSNDGGNRDEHLSKYQFDDADADDGDDKADLSKYNFDDDDDGEDNADISKYNFDDDDCDDDGNADLSKYNFDDDDDDDDGDADLSKYNFDSDEDDKPPAAKRERSPARDSSKAASQSRRDRD
eukprot:TRINITY_DN10557_c0_g1_i2.p1 TRINITY_DN10557_c0_g1~~TRINITY_DN10557_c0_g1_i2.p1  ORF type:complete len:197 (+),score=48.97 TRINITY_DN10557_c0_g1_i2:629-1219(+)